MITEKEKKEQKELLNTVLSKLEYKFTKEALVKPLPHETVEKDIGKPVDTGKKDADGYTISDSETVKETVLTNFRKGILLAIPSSYEWQNDNHPEVGDIVVYSRRAGIDFDLFKDSQLVRPYDIVAYIKQD